MSKLPWKKNLYLCLPTFKCLPLITQDQPQPSDVDTLMITTDNTYHQESNSSDQSTSKSITASEDFFSSSSDSEPSTDFPLDFATLFASRRFFFSSPGSSNSIVESHNTKPYNGKASNVTRGVTVSKFSSNPYSDFRKSMEDMLEARDHIDNKNGDINVVDLLKSDLDYLHELFICYLQLNPRDAHKDIINAFTDLVICILSAIPAATTSASQDVDDHHKLDKKEEGRLPFSTSVIFK